MSTLKGATTSSQVSLPLKWFMPSPQADKCLRAQTIGGKGAFNGKLAKWIIGLMPPHEQYVEPFFGGGSVLLHKNPEGVSEVANDLNSELINFWAVLRTPEWFAEFQRCIEATPFSEAMFQCAANPRLAELFSGAVDRAVQFFILCRQSRQGLQKDFATLSKNRTRGGMNEQVSSWLTAVEGLPDVHARLKRVVVLNRPASEVIRQMDTPATVFYLDPPYLHETRSTVDAYKHEMSVEDHQALLEQLAGIKGKFLLSGYRSGIYDVAAESQGWNRHDYQIANNASSAAVKEVKTECLWTNF
jgi:DNA adenine methylase